MNKRLITIFCLAFFSLACLGTSAAVEAVGERDEVATGSEIGQTYSEPVAAAEPTLTNAPQLCAVVVAIDALHLRKGPSADDIVLTWLRSGDVVHVLDQGNPEWWRVEFEEVEGFARSMFLEEVRCDDERAR